MDCWTCEKTALGSCRFCGRGTCRDHAKNFPYIVSLYSSKTGPIKAVVVEDALHCGVCKPRDDPVEVPGLE